MDFAERVENGDTSLQTHKGTRDTPVNHQGKRTLHKKQE